MKKSVLVVDDSSFIYEEIKLMLENTDYSVIGHCVDGESAVKKYTELQPDIVTMDIVMPGIDGFETTQIILKNFPNARIIIISSLAYNETVEISEAIGAKGFIFKPIEKEHLLNALDGIDSGDI